MTYRELNYVLHTRKVELNNVHCTLLLFTFTFPDDEEVEHQRSETLPTVAEEAEVDPVPQTSAVPSVEPEAEAVSDEAEADDSVAMPANLQEDITASPDKKADAKKAKKPEVAKKVQPAVGNGKIFCCLITFKSVEEDIYGRYNLYPLKTFQFI